MRLQILRQESVKTGDWENMENATSSSKEKDVILQEPPYGLGEIFQTGILASHCRRNSLFRFGFGYRRQHFTIYLFLTLGSLSTFPWQPPWESKHGKRSQQNSGSDEDHSYCTDKRRKLISTTKDAEFFQKFFKCNVTKPPGSDPTRVFWCDIRFD